MYIETAAFLLLITAIQQDVVAGSESNVRADKFYDQSHSVLDGGNKLRGRRHLGSTESIGITSNDISSSSPESLLNYINGDTLTARINLNRESRSATDDRRTKPAKYAYRNEVIANTQFMRDFPEKFNPRSGNDRVFEFQLLEDEVLLDNAAFMRVESSDLLDMVSVPFGRWLPQTRGLPATAAVYDATVATQQALTVGAQEVLSAKLVFNCRTVNTELHSFPANAVSNATNDPRLASCGLYLTDLTSGSGLEFAILLTNGIVWGTYSRQLATRAAIGGSFEAFDVYRVLKIRQNKHELVDAGIEIDRRRGETRYYVDKQLVWTVNNWGVFSEQLRSDEQNKIISYTPPVGTVDSQQLEIPANPESFVLSIINGHRMDVSDPNQAEITTLALVRLSDQPNYYEPHIEFADEKSRRFSSLFGQGCIAGLKQLIVVRQTSASQQQEATFSEKQETTTTQTIDRQALLTAVSPTRPPKSVTSSDDIQANIITDGANKQQNETSAKLKQIAIEIKTARRLNSNIDEQTATEVKENRRLQQRLQQDRLREQQLEQLQRELAQQEKLLQLQQLQLQQHSKRVLLSPQPETKRGQASGYRDRRFFPQLKPQFFSNQQQHKSSTQQAVLQQQQLRPERDNLNSRGTAHYRGLLQTQHTDQSLRQSKPPPFDEQNQLLQELQLLRQAKPLQVHQLPSEEQSPSLVQRPQILQDPVLPVPGNLPEKHLSPATYVAPTFERLAPLVNQQSFAFDSPYRRNDDNDYETARKRFSHGESIPEQKTPPFVAASSNHTVPSQTPPSVMRRTLATGNAAPLKKADFYAQLYRQKLYDFFKTLNPLR